MTTRASKPLILTASIMAPTLAMATPAAFATHGSTRDSWAEPEQESCCHPNLSSLSITSTVTDSVCDIIEDAADDWNGVASSDWELTESSSSAIDFKSASLGSSGSVGRMNHFALFTIILSASVEFSTNPPFGDSTVDSNVSDIYTLVKHEMGHLPTMNHNKHSGDENTSAMRAGAEIWHDAQRTITSNDAAALAGKY